jgi:conjugative transfer signal peptidase TraF
MGPHEFRRRLSIVGIAALGIGLIAGPVVVEPHPLLIWNASASAPIGLYRRVAGAPKRGDFVLVRASDEVAKLAAARGYLSRGVPLVKRVAALAGDDVCAFHEAIIIAGTVAVKRLRNDAAGRRLPWWNGCGKLAPGSVFLATKGIPASFDSRYFGPVPIDHVIGRLVPLWTE